MGINPGELNRRDRLVEQPDEQGRQAGRVAPLLFVVVLDESGSMERIKDATISGYNEYLLGNRNNSRGRILLTRLGGGVRVGRAEPIGAAEQLTPSTYRPSGGTPLYDAIGDTLRAVDALNDSESARIMLILTDGQENESSRETLGSVRQMIEDRERNSNGLWTFIYVGANQDAWAVSRDLGVSAGNTMAYTSTPQNAARVWSTATATASFQADRVTRVFRSARSTQGTSTVDAFAAAGVTNCTACGAELDPTRPHVCAAQQPPGGSS